MGSISVEVLFSLSEIVVQVVVQVALPETPSGPQFMVLLMNQSYSSSSISRGMIAQGAYTCVTTPAKFEAVPVSRKSSKLVESVSPGRLERTIVRR